MSGSGRETFQDIREWSVYPPDVREWSGGFPGCQGVDGRPSRMSGSGREVLLIVREWSVDPHIRPGVVERPSQMSGSGQ